MISDLLSNRSEVIQIDDVERVGKILGLIFKSRPEGILQGLSTTNMAFRLCCVVALEQIKEKKIAFAIMDNLNVTDDPTIVKRAVKILLQYVFSDDFRVKGAVTDYLLNLGNIIQEPVNELLPNLENDIDRKVLVDLVESVGGVIDPNSLRKKGEQKIILSDSRLDDVLDRRKKAMEDLDKYDRIIQASHTQELTIMFTDVKGYTAFSSRASLSEVMGMLKQHDDILIPILDKHSGKILKKIGDAFLVIFEVPSKALLAGIEIQRKLKEYNSGVSAERQLAVRIAINTGPVIRRESDVYGDAVNVASRLEGVADAEQIVISETTFEKIDQQIFEVFDHGQHRLKGIEKPLQTYRVKW
jgi:class 3 adenylate cyclase